MATELALPADPGAIERAADPGEFVVGACERAKAWLREALEHGEIGLIADARSQAEAVRVYTMQKQLGRDAQLAAAEIVRRAERGIGLAIRRGQERGEIRRQGHGGGQPPGAERPRADKTMSSPGDFASASELRGNGAGIYHLTDGVSEEEFEAALTAATAEQDLSRANVVRKIRHSRCPAAAQAGPAQAGPARAPGRSAPGGDRLAEIPADRCRDLVAQLAARRMTTGQIADRLGVREERVRQVAREHRITIPADAVTGRVRLDATRIARQAVHALEGLAMSVQLADLSQVDPAQTAGWGASLDRSLRVLRRFANQIKQVPEPAEGDPS